ncbi:carbonic anhydrase [Winogradskya humida]|uniref:carbonic anhydrase n=1 Tax=Winogradskya humida TaxID=113566 RepID=A0ABQ3ZUG4_9ACTN|nr:carbonic anhydrase [Actinoplanes humidus]GIE22199.1 carbonic anhydrase [Actinoplanes humidus]
MSRNDLSRRSLLLSGGAAALGAAGLLTGATPAGAAAAEDPAVTPTAALGRLLAGNRRFVAGHARHPHQGLQDLHDLATGQHPFAITIGCADSRVSPEVLFDQGLGDIFDNRVAGNIVDDLLLGSIEFAVEEFGSPLIVVLGHERCGAINATINAITSGGTAPGHIGAIVDALRPIVEPVLSHPGDVIDNAVRANIEAQAAELVRRSALIAEHIAAGQVRVVGARYDLDNGHVTLL